MSLRTALLALALVGLVAALWRLQHVDPTSRGQLAPPVAASQEAPAPLPASALRPRR